MKNLQKFALALLVGIMAIGFSAFTSSKPVNKAKSYRTIPAGFLVQVSNGIYEYRSSLSAGNCEEEATNPCHYAVASSNNIPSSQTQWTKAQVDTYSGVSNPAGGNLLFVQ